jgi:hypothetical protein
MNAAVSRDQGLGADFPGKGSRFLLQLLLPACRREEFVGDLIEEAETDVLPRRGRRAALVWFWWQAATSASPMHVRRCAREIGMNRQRWVVVAAILIFGPLMALDSGMAGAPPKIIGLVVVAVAIPAAAGLLSGNLRVHGVAALVSTVLLIVARLSSGVELRWYAMPWIFFSLLMMNWLYEHKNLSSGRGDGSAGPRPAT